MDSAVAVLVAASVATLDSVVGVSVALVVVAVDSFTEVPGASVVGIMPINKATVAKDC